MSHNAFMSQVCPKYRDIAVPKFHKITNINGLADGTGLAGMYRYIEVWAEEIAGKPQEHT